MRNNFKKRIYFGIVSIVTFVFSFAWFILNSPSAHAEITDYSRINWNYFSASGVGPYAGDASVGVNWEWTGSMWKYNNAGQTYFKVPANQTLTITYTNPNKVMIYSIHVTFHHSDIDSKIQFSCPQSTEGIKTKSGKGDVVFTTGNTTGSVSVNIKNTDSEDHMVALSDDYTAKVRRSTNVYTLSLNTQTTSNNTAIYLCKKDNYYLDAAMKKKMTTKANPVGKPTVPSGYAFRGYFTGQNGSGTKVINENGYLTNNSLSKTLVSKNTTIYAFFEKVEFELTFDKNGGNGGTEAITATKNKAMPGITLPKRNGYIFDGYYDALTDGTKYYNADGSSAKNWDKSADTTLYARWSKKGYDNVIFKMGDDFYLYDDEYYQVGENSITGAQISDFYEIGSLVNIYDVAYVKSTDKVFVGFEASNHELTLSVPSKAPITPLGFTVAGNGTSENPYVFESSYITYMDYNSSTGSYDEKYLDANSANIITQEQGQYFEGSEGGTWYYLDSNLNINRDGDCYKVVNGVVNLILSDDSSLTMKYNLLNGPTLRIEEGATLNIYGQRLNTGSLTLNNEATNSGALDLVGTLNVFGATLNCNGNRCAIAGESAIITMFGGNINANNTGYWYSVESNIMMFGGEIVSNGGEEGRAFEGFIVTGEAFELGVQKWDSTNSAWVDATLDEENKTNELKVKLTCDIKHSNVYIGNTEITGLVTEGEGWSYDFETNTLTLDGFNYNGTETAIYSENDLNIVVKGENNIVNSLEENQKIYAMNIQGKLTITGNGILNVSTTGKGGHNYAIASDSTFTIDGPTINAVGGNAVYNTAGLYCNNDGMNILSGDVTAIGGISDNDLSWGFAVPWSDVTIGKDVIKVVAVGNTRAIGWNGKVINGIKGKGYTDVAGTEGEEVIAITEEGLELTTFKKVEFFITPDDVVDLIDAIGNVADIEYTDEYKEKIEAARNAYNSLSDTDKALVNNYNTLLDAEAAYATLKADNEAADAVDELINNIGTVEYTDECKDKIDAAKDAYDGLTNDQKALVDNYANLEKAINDYNKVDEVVGKIKAIGEVEYTPESKALIDDARNAFNALEDDQEALVPQVYVDALEDAEDVYDVMDIINAIGEVELTSTSKGKINAARNAYKLLDDEKKALVKNYETLTNAEVQYDNLLETYGEAKVGNKIYPTLIEAYDELPINGTIVLRKDVDLSNEHIAITKSFVIDLNGHILKTTMEDGTTGQQTLLITTEDTVVTIKNSKPETGGVDGSCFVAETTPGSHTYLAGSYVKLYDCRLIISAEIITGYLSDVNKIADGFEILNINQDGSADENGFVSIVRLVEVFDISNLDRDYEVPDGQTLTGELEDKIKISIADGATVTLVDAVINVEADSNYNWAGITCLGDATIILHGNNIVKGFYNGAGIFVPEGSTLTIDGDGTLYVSGGNNAAGIGGNANTSNGNIIINGGYIAATGGNYGAGIGGGYNFVKKINSGNIIINGGVVRAQGGNYAAGIGSSDYESCGNIVINGGYVIAEGGIGNPSNPVTGSAGIGSGYGAQCGDITINSTVAKVIATGTGDAEPIGKGAKDATCGTVTVDDSLNDNTTEKIRTIYRDSILYIAGSLVTDSNSSGEGWSYDKDTNILTLTDFEYNGPAYIFYEYFGTGDVFGSIINYNGNEKFTINLVGDNNIVNSTTNNIDLCCIHASGELEITGTGSLNVLNNGKAAHSYGIASGSTFTIDGPTIDAVGGDALYNTAGLYCNNGGMIISNGTIYSTGGISDNGYSWGIAAPWSDVTIGEDVIEVIAKGYTRAIGWNGKVINGIKGKGYTDFDGTEGETKIAITSEGEELTTFKRIDFICITPEDVADLIDLIDDVEFTDECKEKIDAAREAYESLDDTDKALVDNYNKLVEAEDAYAVLKADNEAADAVDELINNIRTVEYTPESKELIDIAKDAYDGLTDDQKALVDNYADLEKAINDYNKVDEVVGKIKAIGEVEYTETSKGLIDDARNAFNALEDDQEALVPQAYVYALEDAEALYDVMDKIDEIGDVEYTNECKELIDIAKDAYNALENNQKALVDNYADLEKAINDYNKVDEVVGKIKAIGVVEYTPESKALIADARNAFDALEDDQEEIVPETYIDALLDAEAVYDAMDKINAIDVVEYTPESKALIDAARSAYDDLTAGQQEKVLAPFVKALLDAEALYDVMDKINAIGEVKYTPTSKGKIDIAKEAYDALATDQKALVKNYANLEKAVNDYNKVDEVVGKIKAIGEVEYTPESKGLIDAARNAFDALEDDQEALVPPLYSETLIDDEIAYDVMDKISAIDEVEYTPESKALIDTARNAYDQITSKQQSIVKNYYDLTKAEALYRSLENSAKANHVIELINAIGDVEYTASCKELIEIARNEYNNLTDDQKVLIPYSTLKLLIDAEIVYDVMGVINAIGNVEYTEKSKALIDAAKNAYNQLSNGQKQLVKNYIDLENAINDYNKVEDVVNKIKAIGVVEYTPASNTLIKTARGAYDQLTPNQKQLVPAQFVKALLDAEAAYEAMNKIEAIGEVEYTPTSKTLIDAVKNAYDKLTVDQQNLVTNTDKLEQALNDYEKVNNAVGKIRLIGEVEYTPESKALIDAAREAYDSLSPAQKSIVPEYNLKSLENNEAAYDAMDKIEAIGVVEYTPECKTLIDTARTTYDSLNDRSKLLVKNYDVLLEAEKAYRMLADQTESNAVKELINAIGEVEYTPECKALIDNAKEAYDNLTDDQKSLVDNENVLDKAIIDYNNASKAIAVINKIDKVEYTNDSKTKIDNASLAYAELTADQKAIIPAATLKILVDANKAYDAMDKINEIGQVEYTNDSKTKIDNAKQTYDSLTADQKALVNNSDTLNKDIKTYEDIDAVYLKINSMPNVEYTEASKKEIDDARSAYDNLTDEEKALVPNTDKLTQSEDTYKVLERDHKTFVGWMVALAIIGGILLVLFVIWLLLFFVFNKWIIDNGRPVRAFRISNKNNKVRLLKMPCMVVNREEHEVFSNKADVSRVDDNSK